jgi:hypothetical protein
MVVDTITFPHFMRAIINEHTFTARIIDNPNRLYPIIHGDILVTFPLTGRTDVHPV